MNLLRRWDSGPYRRAFSLNSLNFRLECAPICPRFPTTSRRFPKSDGLLAKAPRRRLAILRTHVVGDTACVEAELRDPDRGADWSVPFVAVLTIRAGQVAIDRTYADWSRWPGL